VLGERTYPTLEDIICVNSAVLNKPLLASQFCAVVPEMGFAPAVASNAVKDHYAMDAYGQIVPTSAGPASAYASSVASSLLSAPTLGPTLATSGSRLEYGAIPHGGGMMRPAPGGHSDSTGAYGVMDVSPALPSGYAPSVGGSSSMYGPMLTASLGLPSTSVRLPDVGRPAPSSIYSQPSGGGVSGLATSSGLLTSMPPAPVPHASLYASLPQPSGSSARSLPESRPELSSGPAGSSGKQCDVCCECKSKWVVLIPCGHTLCKDCSEKLREAACPFCRVRYQSVHQIFI
jgi:hypothetical protein